MTGKLVDRDDNVLQTFDYGMDIIPLTTFLKAAGVSLADNSKGSVMQHRVA